MPSVLHADSDSARQIKQLILYFTIAAIIVFLTVTILVIYISRKYRQRSPDEKPKQTFGNSKIEYLMLGIPTLMVILFFYLTVKTMINILPPAGKQQPDVVITGHQWWWQVYYPKSNVTAANEVHLPVHKRLLIQLNSADVIHDWWVPELGTKMDMIPGRNNHLWLTIDTPGIYSGTCSEFCGAQHAWMRIRVVAQPDSSFEQWLIAHRQNAVKPLPADTLAEEGRMLFDEKTCGDCHRINGTIANGDVGPDLSHLASRATLLCGVLPNTPDNLKKWLSHPQQVKPGAHMPDFILSKHSVNALVAYLSSLK